MWHFCRHAKADTPFPMVLTTWLSCKQGKMRKLPVLIFIFLSISRSLQKKSKLYNLINTFASSILISQANLHGHATLPVAWSVFCHFWIRGVAKSPTRHVLQQPSTQAMPGVLPMQTGLKEMDGITVTQKKMSMRSSRKRSHLAANMVREGLTNHCFEHNPKSQNTKWNCHNCRRPPQHL